MSLRDPLTQLPTEELFRDRLEQAMALAQRKRSQVGVVQFRLDPPAAGPELVKALSRRLEQALRASDTVSRTSGEHFVVLLNDVDSRSAARAVAEELSLAVRKPLQIGDARYQLDARYGLALFPDDADDAAGVLQAAADALDPASG
jgi:diguanylate cyclase (GGDEF)-like protein